MHSLENAEANQIALARLSRINFCRHSLYDRHTVYKQKLSQSWRDDGHISLLFTPYIVLLLSLPGYYCDSCGITAHPEKVGTMDVFSVHFSSIVQAWKVHSLKLTTLCREAICDITLSAYLSPYVDKRTRICTIV